VRHFFFRYGLRIVATRFQVCVLIVSGRPCGASPDADAGCRWRFREPALAAPLDGAPAHVPGGVRTPYLPREATMAKGQMKANKETKKPKADKAAKTGTGSAYKQSQGGGISATTETFSKKK
jgi:hypothetical protein